VELHENKKTFLGVKQDVIDDATTNDASINVIGYHPMNEEMMEVRYWSKE
jgi:hypothetical protein